MMELINNAVKYTPPQEHIEVDLSLVDNWIRIRVSNTGVEIPAEHLPHIFEKFYRVTALDRYRQGGTGLGLPLIKKAIELMKGQIEVQSEDNRTCFTVEFPFTA
jgi:signal transduction histidine kinase